jgi:hypothetical protein
MALRSVALWPMPSPPEPHILGAGRAIVVLLRTNGSSGNERVVGALLLRLTPSLSRVPAYAATQHALPGSPVPGV